MALKTFRDLVATIVPRWLQGFWGSRLLFACASQLDAMTDNLIGSIRLRFPNVYSNESLPLLGRDRGVRRGFQTDEAYGEQLEGWLDDARRLGNPWNTLGILQKYFSPHVVKLRYVTNDGTWRTLNEDGTRSFVRTSSWNWDGDATQYSRVWLIVYPPADLWVDDGVWDETTDETWDEDPDATWDSNATIGQVESLRAQLFDCIGPHAQLMNIIIAFDPDAFDPANGSPPNPDGNWKWPGKLSAGLEVLARDDSASYGDGVY